MRMRLDMRGGGKGSGCRNVVYGTELPDAVMSGALALLSGVEFCSAVTGAEVDTTAAAYVATPGCCQA